MGIPGIYKQIGPGERIALSKLAVEHLEDTGRPLRIAIDISIWQIQVQSGQGGKNPALRTLYYRLLRLLALSMQPLFVFDGPHKPPFKRGKKIAPGATCLPDFLTKELLKRFGFPYHVAPGEAEAECALFQKEALVDAVLSEDVDTLMFGCGMTLRNWTAEGVRGNKSPTHVNVYRAEATEETAGLDGEGMILVALMSGGDYIPAGMPGCGPKTACEAAKAGFGRDLCSIPKGDDARLKGWRDRLGHELHTNESKHFRQKHKALRIPESFPDVTVLGYYTNPTVSSKEKVAKLRKDISWSSEIKVSELRSFVDDAFSWSYLAGAHKFIRGLAPALLAHQLIGRSASYENDEDNLEAKESAEARIVKAVCDRRSHWNTDGMPELRIAYVPNEIVQIDLDAEEKEDFEAYNASDDEQPTSGHEDARDRSRSPSKKRGPSTYDPTKIEKIWVLETYVKLGVPLLVETWEEDMRNPKKFASRKARVAKTLSKSKAKPVTKSGAMDGYFKVTKPGLSRAVNEDNPTKDPESDQLPPVFLPPTTATSLPSPQKKRSSEDKRPARRKEKEDTNELPQQRNPKAKLKPPASKTSSPSTKDITTNPWTLSKRPHDTINFRSPTRYSALGIYAPTDSESLEQSQNPNPLSNNKQETPISPPASPTPRKRRSRPTSPTSGPESTNPTTPTPQPQAKPPLTPHTSRTKTPNAAGRLTPSTQNRDHTKPSPRKKRSPLEEANGPYLSQQLRTPTSIRKATMLDVFLERGVVRETLTAKKVNRTLHFTQAQTISPASDNEEFPSPSALISSGSKKASRNGDGGVGASAGDGVKRSNKAESAKVGQGGDGARTALVRVEGNKRLVALRESLEGAWKCLEPWEESKRRAAKGVWKGVEVVDLTGG